MPADFVEPMPMTPYDQTFINMVAEITSNANVLQSALKLHERAMAKLRHRTRSGTQSSHDQWGFVFRRLFTVCVQLACKMLHDTTYTNSSIAEAIGVDLASYNRMESYVMLDLLEGSAWVNMKEVCETGEMYEEKANLIRQARERMNPNRSPFEVHQVIRIRDGHVTENVIKPSHDETISRTSWQGYCA